MGGVPRLALNIAGWPVEEVPLALLADVLRGARDAAAEAGVAIVGGHTITTEKEPLFGMVAIGFVDPALLIRNATAAPGMTLVLTKPIGTGLIATAIKRDGATPEQAVAAVATMRALNAGAAAAATTAGVGAGTDVTGFGLLGHLHQMLQASGCEAVVDAAAVPTLPGVLALARADMVPGGTKRNLSWVRSTTVWGDLSEPERLVLADAQTSGGLLLATHEPEALVAALDDRGVAHARIGRVVEGEPGRIVVEGRLQG